MAVLTMHKVVICAMKEDRKNILELLQRKGCMEVHEELIDSKAETTEAGLLSNMNTATQISIFDKNTAMSERALDILQEYFPEQTGMFSSLRGLKKINLREYGDIVERQQELLNDVGGIISAEKQIADYRTDIAKYQSEIEALRPWISLDVPMNYTGSKVTGHLFGGISGSYDEQELLQRLQIMHAPTSLHIQVVFKDKYRTYVSCVFLKEQIREVELCLKKLGFTKSPVIAHHLPGQSIENRRARIRKTELLIEDLTKQIHKGTALRDDIKQLADYYRSRSAKYKVLGDLAQSKHTFLITGYMPCDVVEKIREEIEEQHTAFVAHERIQDEDQAPVILRNNQFTGAVEEVVKSFALPTKKEVDPTAVTAFFYYFLFGIMLSDAAYGFIMFLGCFILLKKFPNMPPGMRKTFRMFMYCGISTLIWGILFGGYFGNAISVISTTFFGTEINIAPLWFEPVTKPMQMLVYCMVFGVIHLFCGLGIKGYLLLKEKDIMAFVFDVLMWYLLLIGLLLMLIPTSIFSAFIDGTVIFPLWLTRVSKTFVVIGVAGILLMAGRRAKNPAKRILLGAYSLYDITSWLSDLLSYSRLLALGLATGVIAQVINTMAAMGGRSVGGVILFVVVFVFGHLFNMAINLLGAYVHTNRLQFVEFFGKFYEGGGKDFTPFQTETKYIRVNDVGEKV